MGDCRYALMSVLLSAAILLLACSNSADKQNQVAKTSKQQQSADAVAKNEFDSRPAKLKSATPPLANSDHDPQTPQSLQQSFAQIVEAAAAIDTSYAELQIWTQQFLANAKPDNEIENERCMTVTAIAAACHFLAGDLAKSQNNGQAGLSLHPGAKRKIFAVLGCQNMAKNQGLSDGKKIGTNERFYRFL